MKATLSRFPSRFSNPKQCTQCVASSARQTRPQQAKGPVDANLGGILAQVH
jgi:hypothetical protein